MKDVWNLMERLLKLVLFSCPRFFFPLLGGSSCDRALLQCPHKDSTEKIISSHHLEVGGCLPISSSGSYLFQYHNSKDLDSLIRHRFWFQQVLIAVKWKDV